MSNGNNQGNKLFVVCPFCQMENFIVKHYGEVFFFTAPASILNIGSEELVLIKEFITRENIRGIYLVGETSCNFTKNALDNANNSGLPWENEIQKMKSADDTLSSLTLKILREQAKRLHGENFFGKEIASGTILLHTLQTVKNENKIKKIK
jgi:hypothetical protein